MSAIEAWSCGLGTAGPVGAARRLVEHHDLGAGHGRRADLLADHQHVVELDLVARGAGDALDRELLVGGDRVLLSTRADNGDHDDT